MGTKIRPISVISGQEFRACLVYTMSQKHRALGDPLLLSPTGKRVILPRTQLAEKLQGLSLWEKVLAQDRGG